MKSTNKSNGFELMPRHSQLTVEICQLPDEQPTVEFRQTSFMQKEADHDTGRFIEMVGNDNDREVSDKMTRAGYSVSPQAVHKWRHGIGNITKRNIMGLCKVYDTSEAWFMLGIGPKEAGKKTTGEEAQLMEALPEDIRQQTFDFIGYQLTRPGVIPPEKLPHYFALLDRIKAAAKPDSKSEGSRKKDP